MTASAWSIFSRLRDIDYCMPFTILHAMGAHFNFSRPFFSFIFANPGMPKNRSPTRRSSAAEVPPKFIEKSRIRNACFAKRQIGFLKKAVHLSVNTGSDIAIIIRRNVDKDKAPLAFASNGDVEELFRWWMNEQAELRTVSSSLLTEHSNELQSKMTTATNESIALTHWNGVPLGSSNQTPNESSTAEIADLMHLEIPNADRMLISLPPATKAVKRVYVKE